MCGRLLENRFSAIKSTLKVEPCLFMTKHKRQSANATHIKACNNRVLWYPKMVPDYLSSSAVYGCQFHITGRCCKSLLCAERRKNISANKSGGQRYDIELSGWLHVTSWSQVPLMSCLEKGCGNIKPWTIHPNKSCQLDTVETSCL